LSRTALSRTALSQAVRATRASPRSDREEGRVTALERPA
jgi:hypothetical protein